MHRSNGSERSIYWKQSRWRSCSLLSSCWELLGDSCSWGFTGVFGGVVLSFWSAVKQPVAQKMFCLTPIFLLHFFSFRCRDYPIIARLLKSPVSLMFCPSSLCLCGSCPRNIFMAPKPQREAQEGHAAAGCVLRPPKKRFGENLREAKIY